MKKRPQDKSGILSEVSRFAATMPLHRNAENVDPIYNLAARLRQNTVSEKLTNLWLERLFSLEDPRVV